MDGMEQQVALVLLMRIVSAYRRTHPDIVDAIVLHVAAAEEAPQDRDVHLEAALREAARIGREAL